MMNIKGYESMAMLELPDDEREELTGRFNAVVTGYEALERVDTDGVAPLVTVLDVCNIMREDVAEKFITRDELLANSPEEYDGYFKVPGTLA